MAAQDSLPVLDITQLSDWQQWLDKYAPGSHGVWLKLPKKASGLPIVTYDQVLDIALCYGWIDGQRNRFDENYFIQKFTPRRPRSLWSKRNIEKIEALTAAGKMQPSGLRKVEAAKNDGRWQAAYDSQKNMTVPNDFAQELDKYPEAKDFFETLNRSNTYAILFSIATAKKPETRQRRIQKFITMLLNKEKLY